MKSGFKMKGYSYPGKSPVTQKAKEDKFLKWQREEAVKSTDYLTKTPVGPRADVKKPKNMTDKENEIDAAKWQLEDKMKDEGVFSIGGQNKKQKKKKKLAANKASNKKRSDAERALEAKEDAMGL